MSYTPIFHYECLKRAPSQSMEASGSLDGPESPTKSKDAPPLNVTCLEFDPLGRYLAIADVGGRVTVLNTNQNWSVAYEYRSHTQQFDCLKSQQIDEKINAIRWLKPISQSSSSLLVTNEKVIKLWRLHGNGEKSLRKSFQNHTCAINGLSLSMDGTCFASSDDLRVEYWHFDHPERSLNVLDIKPADMSDLSEVITGIAFHSEEPHLLAISSSSGNIKVVDVRNPVESRGKRSALLFEIPRGEENEMTDILSCVADCAFSNKNGGTLVTRDYLHVRSWDVRNPSAPVSTIPVHDHIVRPYLTDLYENDLIFDRFICRVFTDGERVITGSYGSQFSICNIASGTTELASIYERPTPDSTLDFEKKVGAVAPHPKGVMCAVAIGNEVTVMSKESATK